MIGETVTVYRREQTGEDDRGDPIFEDVAQTVDNVLVAPGPLADMPDSVRPTGTLIAWNLHFPKTFSGNLRGALVSVRGLDPAEVVGDPHPYTLENTPTDWWLPVELRRAEG